MNKIPVWIDTDTGVDDAIALICAFNMQELEVVGVSAVAGNQTIDKTFKNARDVVSLCGHEEVKVFKGASKPLKRDLVIAPKVHGENGLGDAIIPESKAPIEEMDVEDAIYECALKYKGELVLVPVGPLTNIALALNKHPDLVNLVKSIAIMGGAVHAGNRTPFAEFNIYNDGEAGNIVFDSGLPIAMCGLDCTRHMHLTIDDCKEIGSYDNKFSKLFKESIPLLLSINERIIGPGLCIHDACPLFYLAHPEKFVTKSGDIYVEVKSKIRYGQTVFKENNTGNETVVLSGDRDWLAEEVKKIYRGC